MVRAASLDSISIGGCTVAHLDGHSVAIFRTVDGVFAVDNRCPHMGFPLSKGSVEDCVLTCHWHHARFDLTSGGTFDPWADDVRSFPVEVRNGDIWVDLSPAPQPSGNAKRLQEGLERDIPLVIAKSVLRMMDVSPGDSEIQEAHNAHPKASETESDPGSFVPGGALRSVGRRGFNRPAPTSLDAFRTGLEFGLKNRQSGWGQGLTILACMQNLCPRLRPGDRPRAMYQGLSAVARDCAGHPPRHLLRPLPGSGADMNTLKRWFRRFVEVRDAEGAERCLLTAVQQGGDHRQLADLLFSAATDHRYITVGHPLDFTNKAFESLDAAGWQYAESALSALANSYAMADRMEESNAWRNPIDLVDILEQAFARLPENFGTGLAAASLIPIVLGDDPRAIADFLVSALSAGIAPESLAGIVSRAAALRIARFHTNNEFPDWDRALHTFTFANAVQMGLRRSDSRELVRGVFDAAMSVYLDRFLNIPPARIPDIRRTGDTPSAVLQEMPELLNEQHRVNEAGDLTARFLDNGGEPADMMAELGRGLIREDRDFHTIQCVEAACNQYSLLMSPGFEVDEQVDGDLPSQAEDGGRTALIAAARYLAAHSPTMRAQGQTYQIAERLHRGDRLFEE